MTHRRWILIVFAGLVACRGEDEGDTLVDPGPGRAVQAVSSPFSFSMAGVLLVGNEPLDGTATELLNAHFSYLGQYAVNGCANNTPPYSCANNGCNYPGNPSAEILGYLALRDWMVAYGNAGFYVGLWGVTYDNVEAEAHCMAEVANTLKSSYGVTATFYDIDGEKKYETNQGYSQRFVTEFRNTLTFPIFKAYTPECHTAVPMAPWLDAGYASIMPMAYWDDPTVGTNPSYCLNWILAYGVPISRAQVMLDGYRHGTPHSWNDYALDIRTVPGAKGFSIWRTPAQAEWAQWKTILETQTIATYDGSDGGSATSDAGVCTNDCTQGAKRCVNTDLYQDCGNYDSDSCTEWSPNYSCGTSYPGTTCSNGYCVGCTDGCTAGAAQCADATHRQVCGNYDADSCTEWGPATVCAAGASCTAGQCRPAPDAGGSDAGRSDAGGYDAGRSDAGRLDAGGSDAGGPDAGRFDAGRLDAGGSDAGGSDASGSDASGFDGGGSDAGSSDAGSPPGPAPGCGCQAGGLGPWGLLVLATARAVRRRKPPVTG